MSARVARLLLSAELRRRPARFALTALAVAIGVAGFVALRAGTRAALASAGAALTAVAGPVDLVVVVAGAPGAALPAAVPQAARALAGVARVLPTVDAPTLPVEDVEGWTLPLFPGEETGLRALGAQLDDEVAVGRVVVVDGALPPRPAPGGVSPLPVLVGASWARAHAVGPGKALRLTAPRGPVDAVVAGVVEGTGLGARQGGDVVIAWLADAQRAWSTGDVVEELGLVLADHIADDVDVAVDVDAAAARVAAALGPAVTVAPPASRGAHTVARLKNLEAGMLLTSSLSLFLCGFAVFAIFGTAAAERRRDVGLLRSLGLSPAAAALPIALEAITAGVTGSVVGAGLGAPAAQAVSLQLVRGAGGAPFAVPLSWGDALAGALLGVLVALVAGVVPAARAAREPPLHAVRAIAAAAGPPPRIIALVGVVGLALGGATLLVWPPGRAPPALSHVAVVVVLSGAVALLPQAAWSLGRLRVRTATGWGLRGLAWRPQRAGLAAGAVLGAIAVVGGVASLGEGLHTETMRWAERALSFDLFVRRPAGIDDDDVARWRALAGVTYAAAVPMVPLVVERDDGAPVALTGVGVDDELAARQLELRAGRGGAALRDGEALTTTLLAAQLGLAVGDEVRVRTATGVRRWTLVGEVTDYTSNGYALFVRKATLASLFSHDAPPRAELAVVDVDDDRVDDVARALQAEGSRVERRSALLARAAARVDESLGAIDALGVLAGVIGFLAVAATLLRSTVERRSQLAALRALGATPAQVARVIVTEALALTLLGAVPGALLAVAMGVVFSQTAAALGLPLPTLVPWSAIAVAFVSSLVAATLAALAPARRALTVPPAEALGDR